MLRCVAAHPNTPLSNLESLAENADALIRSAVVSNPKAPTHLLSRLSMDKHCSVRKSVARNTSTSKEDLFRLCKDGHFLIREAVANNISADKKTLALLSVDTDLRVDVRMAVAKNPNIDPDEIFGLDDELNYRALAFSSRDAGKLEFLSTVDDKNVRAAVAQNENAPPSTLLILSKDPDAHVRSHVASNQSTPPEILNGFVLNVEEDQRVVYCSIANPAIDPEPVGECFTSLMSTGELDQRVHLGLGLGVGLELEVMRALSRRDDIPSSALALMSKSRIAKIRIAMAKNRRLPHSDLLSLSEENDQKVANAVADNPTVQGAADAISCLISTHGCSL